MLEIMSTGSLCCFALHVQHTGFAGRRLMMRQQAYSNSVANETVLAVDHGSKTIDGCWRIVWFDDDGFVMVNCSLSRLIDCVGVGENRNRLQRESGILVVVSLERGRGLPDCELRLSNRLDIRLGFRCAVSSKSRIVSSVGV